MPETVVTTEPVAVTETPEFKAALKAEREQLEKNIRESNQTHLAKKEADIESAVLARLKVGSPSSDGKDYFESWGDRHGLPAEAGRELAIGIMQHVQGVVLPGALGGISERQKSQEIRSQRQELRSANPKLAKLDERYHQEALEKVEALKPSELGPDSYAKALQMVIGMHIEELMEKAPEEPNREIVPGVEPQGSPPSPKKSVIFNADQKRFLEERGMEADDFVTMMRERAQALEAKGYTKAQVRGRLGNLVGTIEF